VPWSREKQREYQRRPEVIERQREAVRKYNASPKGIARKQRYQSSDKGEATQERYWSRRASGNILMFLESHRTDIIDLQMLLGRQLRSDELDWWWIVCRVGADKFLKLKEAA